MVHTNFHVKWTRCPAQCLCHRNQLNVQVHIHLPKTYGTHAHTHTHTRARAYVNLINQTHETENISSRIQFVGLVDVFRLFFPRNRRASTCASRNSSESNLINTVYVHRPANVYAGTAARILQGSRLHISFPKSNYQMISSFTMACVCGTHGIRISSTVIENK